MQGFLRVRLSQKCPELIGLLAASRLAALRRFEVSPVFSGLKCIFAISSRPATGKQIQPSLTRLDPFWWAIPALKGRAKFNRRSATKNWEWAVGRKRTRPLVARRDNGVDFAPAGA